MGVLFKPKAPPAAAWTQERVAYLHAHYGFDRTLSEIAEVLGVSRGAVAGKAARLGLKCPHATRIRHCERGQWRRHAGSALRGENPVVLASPERGGGPPQAVVGTVPPPLMPATVAAVAAVYVVEESPPPRCAWSPSPFRGGDSERHRAPHAPSAYTPRPLARLTLHTCRFPVSGEGVDTLFCGAPTVAGTSWCAACRGRVFLPARPIDLEALARFIDAHDRRAKPGARR